MDPVSVVAGVAGLVVSFGTVLRTLERFALASRQFKKSYAQAERLLTDLNNLLLLTDLKNVQSERLSNVLQDIEQRLDDLQEILQDSIQYRKARSLISGFPPRRNAKAAMTSLLLAKNMINMIRTLQELGERENTLLNSVRSHAHASIKDLTEPLQTRHYGPLLKVPNTTSQDIFARIAVPEGQELLHKQCRAERIPGTGEWFLAREEFQSWLHSPSSVLWLRGSPGIGKTILASKVIDQLQPQQVVAYFYMSSGRLHSAADIVTSLLRQLCLPFDIVPERLQQIPTNGKDGYRLALADSLQALRETFDSIHEPITIVIDGLNKTNIREYSEFAQVFDSLKATSWRCLVTSRVNECVLSNSRSSFDEFVIEECLNQQDISNFVKGSLEANEPVDRILRSDPKLRSELIDTLTSSSRGMFYWASLQIRSILDQTHLSGIRYALGSIPRDIHGIVDIAWGMIKLQDKNRARTANRALALLTAAQAAQAPLTAEAMCHALCLAHVLGDEKRPLKLDSEEVPDPESVIECCMGLIKMEPTTRVVTLTHYDISKAMQENWSTLFAPESTAKSTAKLAKICIAYLSLDEFSKGPCHEIDTFRRRLEKYPFLYYASHVWDYHAREALEAESRETDVKDDIDRFLQKPMHLGFSLQVSQYDPDSKQQPSTLFDSHRFLGMSELQIASRYGLKAIVEKLSRTRPEMISTRDSSGRTALHEAAQAGWEDIVSMLVGAGADTTSTDDEGKTPLFYAAESGHSMVISILQGRSRGNRYNQQALEKILCYAAETGKVSVVEKLLHLKVDPDNPNAKRSGMSALTAASLGGHESIVQKLLDNGAAASYEDGLPSNSIPLHQAVRNGHVKIAALLLDFGANIEASDTSGRTALFETLGTPDVRGAALLLKRGIDISRIDAGGENVLHEAARKGGDEQAARFIDRGVNIAMRNKKGFTPLQLAARHSHLKIATLLIQKGANLDNHDGDGWTPLIHAAYNGSIDLTQILLDAGASVDVEEVDQETSQVLKRDPGYHQALQPAVDLDSNLNSKLPDGRAQGGAYVNALQAASYRGYNQVVQMLLDRGADVNAQGGYYGTALQAALYGGHDQVVQMLLDKGADVSA